MNSSQLQDLKLILQSKQGSMKETLGTACRSPTPTSSPVVGRIPNSVFDPNIQLDGLGNFHSMPTKYPLRHQMDHDVLLGSQSLLLERYAALLGRSTNNKAKCFPMQSTTPPPFSTSRVSVHDTNNASPNHDGSKSCSLTPSLPQSQDADFLGRMLLMLSSAGQVTPAPSSPFRTSDMQGMPSPRYAMGTNKSEIVMEREPPFPEKLHRLLRDVETLGRSDVISFVADDTFRIHDPVIFFHDVLPQYFRQTKLSSFKRQLKLYGFELVTKGPTIGGYRHRLFSRSDRTLCREMKRVAIKSRQPTSGTNDDKCGSSTPKRTST